MACQARGEAIDLPLLFPVSSLPVANIDYRQFIAYIPPNAKTPIGERTL